ncbi:hypothetical protein COBT_004120, partial [Conglomerata obtusa]
FKKVKLSNSLYSKDEVIKKYKLILQEDYKKIEFCPLEKCRIKTRNDVKVLKKGCNLPQALEEKAKKHINSLLKSGVIRCLDSTWRNPVRFLEKPNGGIRLVENMINLNNLVEKDPYTLPNMKEIIRAAY